MRQSAPQSVRLSHNTTAIETVLGQAKGTREQDRARRDVAERAVLRPVAARAVSTCPGVRPTRTAGKEKGR
jgi:hypothetical protein